MLIEEPYETLKNYLIMEKIDAPVIKSYMLRKCQASYRDSISEFGIYSCLFARNRGEDELSEIIENDLFGVLMRTKGAECNEGGVNAGFAVVDSPMLVDASHLKPNEVLLPTVKNLEQ